MRRKRVTGGDKTLELSKALFNTPIRITPSTRRKMESLALWLAEGDPRRLKETRAAVIDLLTLARPGAARARNRG